MSKKILVSLSTAASILSLVLIFAIASPAHAASSSLSGWAWSSNIGWISFNSTDSGAGGGPYSVQLTTTPTTGTLSGYAWSSNIGWISFNPGDVSGCPTGSCTPTIDLTTGAVTGWARAIAGVGRTDGWDGWIELSGTHHLSPDTSGKGGVTLNTSNGAFEGYAWGSDVVGWISWAGVFASGLCPGGVCPQNILDVGIAGSGSGVVTGTGDPTPGNNINCGSTCTETVTTATPVTLTATANSGSSFTGWSASSGFTPACSGTGTCSVNISGTDSVTANFTNGGGPTVTSCTIPNFPSVNENSPYTLSLTGASIVVSPAGSYTFLWSDDTVNFLQTSSFTLSNGGSGNLNFPIQVEAKDNSTGLTSAAYTCGTVTVNGNNNVTVPELWPGTPSQKPSNSIFNTTPPPTLTGHAYPNDSVPVSYEWPSTYTYYDCTALGGNGLTPSWSGRDIGNDNLLHNYSGSQTFSNVAQGVYTLTYTCTVYDNANHTSNGATYTKTSNPVEIDVAPSAIREK